MEEGGYVTFCKKISYLSLILGTRNLRCRSRADFRTSMDIRAHAAADQRQVPFVISADWRTDGSVQQICDVF